MSLDANVVDLRRKRKLLAEQLGGLPMPKHKSWNRGHSYEPDFLLDEIAGAEDLDTHLIEPKSASVSLDCSHPESATDSNSIAGDYAMPTPTQSGAKLESKILETCTFNQSSTSSANSGNCMSFDRPNSLYGMDEMEKIAVEDGPIRRSLLRDVNKLLASDKIMEDHLQGSGSHVDYICEEYINPSGDQFTDEEVNNMLYSMSAFNLPLQEPQPSTRKKPTIDKEFEEYFSSLML